jgi:hypothetical protein
MDRADKANETQATGSDPRGSNGRFAFKQFDTVELAEACEAIPAGTICVLLDASEDGGSWLVECFDDAGQTIDVISASVSSLRARPANNSDQGRTAA